MKYQKLTYQGSQCSNYIYFAFDGDVFDTKLITNELNIEPSSVMIKKDPTPKSTSWKYHIDVGNKTDLETPLKKLIDKFKVKITEINRLKKAYKLETRLQFVIDIDINPESSTPFFGLNNKTIDFLYKTKTEVDFDLYKVDSIGFLKKEQRQ